MPLLHPRAMAPSREPLATPAVVPALTIARECPVPPQSLRESGRGIPACRRIAHPRSADGQHHRDRSRYVSRPVTNDGSRPGRDRVRATNVEPTTSGSLRCHRGCSSSSTQRAVRSPKSAGRIPHLQATKCPRRTVSKPRRISGSRKRRGDCARRAIRARLSEPGTTAGVARGSRLGAIARGCSSGTDRLLAHHREVAAELARHGVIRRRWRTK